MFPLPLLECEIVLLNKWTSNIFRDVKIDCQKNLDNPVKARSPFRINIPGVSDQLANIRMNVPRNVGPGTITRTLDDSVCLEIWRESAGLSPVQT